MSNFITPIEKMSINKIDFKENKDQQTKGELPFQNILSDAIAQTTQAYKVTEADNQALIMGDVDNLAQVQINSLKAQAMLQTTVQLTSRVVNAYKEIMQTQI